MGHRHSREDLLAGAVAVAAEHGLSQVSFGRVGRHLGVSDRTVVYYFPTKDDLVGEVLMVMGARLQEALGDAFSSPVDGHLELARAAWPVLADDAVAPTFALFFEATGLAAAGREPYRTLVPVLVDGWVEWAAGFVRGRAARRRAEAEAAVALLDGLLLMRQLIGSGPADRAARRLGVTGR